jgi:predicted acyltransferase
MLANIIYLYAKEHAQAIWFAALLIGYWLILKVTSAPGFAPGDLTMEGNFASYVDRIILPGKLSLGIHDTVGFFNNIPAISTALLGILVGTFLKRKSVEPQKKAAWLAGIGVVLLAPIFHCFFII